MAKLISENEENSGTDLSLFREKRKWQIALRRYVIERNPSAAYAPFFALGIEKMRSWFECQFTEGVEWASFGKNWQFDHVIPVSFFDFKDPKELKLCWNFVNLRVGHFRDNTEKGQKTDLTVARTYFQDIFQATAYPVCRDLISKVNAIEASVRLECQPQQQFLTENKLYLQSISDYGREEFELLNQGRTVEEVNKEIAFARKFGA